MNSNRLLSLLLSLFLFQSSFSQSRCGFEAAIGRAMLTDPQYAENLRRMDESLRQIIEAQKTQRGGAVQSTIYTIPTVVHVIHTGGAVGSSYNPSDAQIQGALNYLNAVYNGSWTGSGGSILGVGDLQVKFVLATRSPNNTATTGINRVDGSGIANYTTYGVNAAGSSGAAEISVKNLSRWDPFKYYNIWLVNKIDGCDGITGCPSFIAGYAYFPLSAGSNATSRNLDGTIMLASQMVAGQKTLPHEIGHALNLYHVFQGETVVAGANTCPPNSTTGGDQCADTNPVTNPADDGEASPFACRTGTGCYGYAYGDNTEKNYMNYTNCYRLFTADQKTRMLASAAGTMRASLATSWANNESTFPVTWSAPASAAITPSSTNTISDVAGIISVKLNNRVVYSLDATQDGGYVDGASKWYNLFDLQRNASYTLSIQLLALNHEQLGVWIDFNNNGVFDDPSERLYLQTHIDKTVAANPILITVTPPPTASTGIIRMRIVEDLSASQYGVPPISNVSTSLTYGQAEDYPVYISLGTLPVQQLSFTGNRQRNSVALQWQATGEVNTKVYSVERADDGVSFLPVGQVPAQGGAGENRYAFTDVNLFPGQFTYRLKIIDADGKVSYGPSRSFVIEDALAVEVTGNPFSTGVQVRLPGSTGAIGFRLFDALGRTVFRQQLGTPPPVVKLEFGALQPGVYFLETTAGGERSISRLVKQ